MNMGPRIDLPTCMKHGDVFIEIKGDSNFPDAVTSRACPKCLEDIRQDVRRMRSGVGRSKYRYDKETAS